MEHHNKQVEGTERLFRFQAAHYNVSGDWEDFITKGQLVQAEALKCAVEHWRRRKFRTAGSLFWQLNDCWPVSSWAVIDSDLRLKAGYFYARRFFAPILVSIVRNGLDIEVWGTSDVLRDVQGRLSVELREFTGRVVWKGAERFLISADSSACLSTVPGAVVGRCDPAKTYVRAALYEGRTLLSENRFFFLEPKHLALPRVRPGVVLRKVAPERYVATVSSRAFALGLCLSSTREGVQFHENFVDVDPGSHREISITSKLPITALRRSLHVRAVNSRISNR